MNFCLFSKKTTSSNPVHPRANKTKEIGYDGLPIGTRKLNFYVDTGATFGSEKIPLVYGSLDSPAEVVTTVTFDTDEDCTGDSVDVTFKATAAVRANDLVVMPNATKGTYEFETGFLTEKILLQKKWTLPVSRVEGKPSVIRKGIYTSHIRVALDPTLPSSFLPSKSFKGGIQYSFHAQVSRFDSHIRKTVATAEADQKIWVLNGNLTPSETNSPLQVTEHALNSSLPVQVSVPAQVVLGQPLPVTFTVKPFALGSKHENQVPVVLSTQFKLLESRHATPRDNSSMSYVQEVVNMPLLTGASPQDVEWSRTIHMTMPASPELTPSSECSLLSIVHSVVVVAKVRAANQKDRQAEEVKLTIPIKVVARSARPEQLPEYSGLENVVVSEKEVDQEVGLPSYSN